MKYASRLHRSITAAAMTGLVAGAGAALVGCHSDGASAGTHVDKAVAGHDCKGQNNCKGQGGCKTEAHSCKGQNNCKGQGGCKSVM